MFVFNRVQDLHGCAKTKTPPVDVVSSPERSSSKTKLICTFAVKPLIFPPYGIKVTH